MDSFGNWDLKTSLSRRGAVERSEQSLASGQLLPSPAFRALVEASTITLWWESTSVMSKAVKCRQPSHSP